MKSKQMSNIRALIADAQGDEKKESVELSIEEFKKALVNVDSQVKFLPATAQVLLLSIRAIIGAQFFFFFFPMSAFLIQLVG